MPSFRGALSSLDLTQLDADGSGIALLDKSARIVWVNREWVRFMRENAGERADELVVRWGPGASYLEGMSERLRDHYAHLLSTVCETGEPYVQHYLCSSDDVHREYRLRLLRIDEHHVLSEHTLISQGDANAPEAQPVDADFRNADGLICQCSNCRRVRRSDGRWQWVPSWVSAPPSGTSHGICAGCCAYYYKDYLPPTPSDAAP